MLDSIQPKQPNSKKIRNKNRSKKNTKSKNWFQFKIFAVFAVLLILGIFVGSRVVTFADKIVDNREGNFFTQLFTASDNKLIGEEQGEIRILLLGIGGEGHDGGTLTDTIILATLKVPQNKDEELKASLISIPRDFAVFIPEYNYRKINSAYAFGEIGDENKGPQMSTATVERVIGKEIPYYAVVDFKGFKKVIDELDGIEINVPVTFTDSRFPDNNEGYLDPITFEKGTQHFDGERALQYVRSRHGTNGQGSDFARSQRQRQVLQALKNEVSNVRILTNFNLINNILEAVSDNFRTNLEIHEMKRLYELGQSIDSENIFSQAIDVENGLLCNEIIEETGAYVLIPCQGLTNYSQIRSLIDNQFTTGVIAAENPQIEIQNATKISGLSENIQTKLNLPAQNVTLANYRGQAQYLETVVYDNTQGEKNGTLEYLKNELNATVAGSAFPFPTVSENPDFVIVVVKNQEN